METLMFLHILLTNKKWMLEEAIDGKDDYAKHKLRQRSIDMWHSCDFHKSCKTSVSNVSPLCSLLRGDYLYQIRWIFGKLPNGLWPPLLPHPYFRKQWCAFFWMCLNLQLKFLDRKWPPPSFWNFSKKSSKMEKGSVPEWAICKNLEHWCIAVCCQKLPKATISHQNLP